MPLTLSIVDAFMQADGKKRQVVIHLAELKYGDPLKLLSKSGLVYQDCPEFYALWGKTALAMRKLNAATKAKALAAETSSTLAKAMVNVSQ